MNILEKKVKIKELWQLCFHDDERFVSLLFDRLYRDENACCMEEKGVVTTALQMLPYCMTFGSTCLDVSYISGASTRPEYRNRGLMSRLLVESFNTMSSGRTVAVWILCIEGICSGIFSESVEFYFGTSIQPWGL